MHQYHHVQGLVGQGCEITSTVQISIETLTFGSDLHLKSGSAAFLCFEDIFSLHTSSDTICCLVADTIVFIPIC